MPKRVIVFEPEPVFADRTTVVTEARAGLGDQLTVEWVKPFEVGAGLEWIEAFNRKIEGADLLVFLQATTALRELVRKIAAAKTQIPVFLAGSRHSLSLESYPPNVTLFAVDAVTVPEGMSYFDARTLRSKILEVLGLTG